MKWPYFSYLFWFLLPVCMLGIFCAPFGVIRAFSNLVLIHPSISTTGYVTDFVFSGTAYGNTTYKGNYPDISLFQCSAPLAGFPDTSFSGSSLEGCFNNGGVPSTDSIYWTVITTGGSAYTPDYNSGTQYYFEYQRIGGLWYTPSNNTAFNSFEVSTSTQTVHITGFWNASTTSGEIGRAHV